MKRIAVLSGFDDLRALSREFLDAAIARISADPTGGYLVYMAGHEGRGIGLWAKATTYLLQDSGLARLH